MDNKSTTKRMIGAVVLVLIAALLLAWLLKGKNKSVQEQQELIAEQTQEASPILGFPGVNDSDDAAGGKVAQNGEAAQDGDSSYVIGSAENATDNAQQQAQNALAAGGDAASSAGQAVADGASNVAAATGAAAATATQAGQDAANATGFQVRDSGENQTAANEQRPIVENGEVKVGTGSMGSNEVAANGQTQQPADSDSNGDTQVAASTAGATGSASDSSATQQQTQTASAGSNAGGSSKPAKTVANPRLVNEKPVPAPRTQSASSGSSGGSASGSSSQSSTQTASAADSADSVVGGQAAGGGEGYAIQVLAASSRSKAENVRQDIARDGYPAFVVRATVNGKTVYRVRVGTYPAKGAARAVQTRMKARYTKNQYVQNSFVTRN